MTPSWQRWPPNCCESCVSWQRKPVERQISESDKWIGLCMNDVSLDTGTVTDARYRCPTFKRKDGV